MEKRHPNHPGKLSADQNAEADARSRGEINARARALKVLLERKLPLMVGGAYAFSRYTGIYRDTKDLDLYLRQPDALAALEILRKQGWRTERTDETWIYKAFRGPWFVDLLFSSGNGMSVVDDDWFRYAVPGEVFGQNTWLIPVEEMIWSKAFVLERERYDGANGGAQLGDGALAPSRRTDDRGRKLEIQRVSRPLPVASQLRARRWRLGLPRRPRTGGT